MEETHRTASHVECVHPHPALGVLRALSRRQAVSRVRAPSAVGTRGRSTGPGAEGSGGRIPEDDALDLWDLPPFLKPGAAYRGVDASFKDHSSYCTWHRKVLWTGRAFHWLCTHTSWHRGHVTGRGDLSAPVPVFLSCVLLLPRSEETSTGGVSAVCSWQPALSRTRAQVSRPPAQSVRSRPLGASAHTLPPPRAPLLLAPFC